MPMYEFFCPECNTIYTFLSRSINTDKKPPCPKCKRPDLDRMISRFAVTGRARESTAGEGAEGDDPMAKLGIDEAKMERAMETLASQAEGIDENNPRQAADLMRKFSELSGLKLGDKMEDALARIEAGADPEALEKEMEGLDESDLFKLDGLGESGAKSKGTVKRAPMRDETLYEM
jgi:putative FmdB family regulatory protein